MMKFWPSGRQRTVAAAFFLLCFAVAAVPAEEPDASSVIQHIDAAVRARFERTLGYTVTEHYAVFRNNDETHPVAEMTVKTTYRKDEGKNYDILSQTGSSIMRKFVLGAILDNEKRVNLPGIREGAWFTSENYEMKLKPGVIQKLDGRDCLVLALTPKRKEPYLIEGAMWVDAKDGSMVQIQGTSSKEPSVFTGPTQMMRQYLNVSGFAMASHSRAVSNSPLFGQTIVTIDYRDYHLQLLPAR